METLRDKSSTIILVILIASLVYLGLIFWGSSDNSISHFASLQHSTTASVISLVTIGYLLRFVRWEFYLNELGYNVPTLASLRIFLASFLMAISPGKVGEASKSFFLKEEFNVPVTPTMAAFFSERFTDVLSMTFLASTGLLIYPGGEWLMGVIVTLELLVLIILQFPDFVESWFFTPFESVDFLSNWVERTRNFYRRSGKLLSPRNLGVGTLLGFLSWGLEGICLAIILRDLGFSEVYFTTAVFVFSASILLGAASMLPGGIGSSEALMIGMLIYFECPREIAVSSTIIVRFATLWFGVGLGIVCWGWTWHINKK